MRGKYSPTVSKAYQKDQEWFRKYCELAPHGDQIYSPYDPDGYDSYGYDKNDVDRAGNAEYVYYSDNIADSYGFSSGNSYYDDAYDEWGFDGVKPVKV
jgi:hypothetical protein